MAAAGRRIASRLRGLDGSGAGLPAETPAAPPAALAAPPAGSIAARLFAEGYEFSFFQAVRLLEELAPERIPVGHSGPPSAEAARFRAHLSLSFPPSQIFAVEPAGLTPPAMTVTFFGLTGPSGILPRHYTELLLRLQKESKGPEGAALRDWLDLFNHRLLSLFYRAWAKYRFHVHYARGEHLREEPDSFTRALRSFVGLGMPPLQRRLRVSHWDADEAKERVLARLDDLTIVYYGGLFSQRPRSAVALQALLEDYFQMPVQVRQFVGQWLQLEPGSRSVLGPGDCNNALGSSTVAGERVWDVLGRIRLRLGPLDYRRFVDFIPDRAPTPARKAFFLLVHLVRLFVGPELTFDVQVLLKASEIPACCLGADEDDGPRLGWNTWVLSHEPEADAEDATFEGDEVTWVNERPGSPLAG
jgi:type VI secretion system protein ImpH